MKCKIVKDLFPSYLDGLTSQESNEAVEEHLAGCEECRECLAAMREESFREEGILDREHLEADIRPFKKLRRVVFGTFAAICILGMILEAIQIYCTTGVTPSSDDVYVEYEKTGNLVTVSLYPKKDSNYIHATMCDRVEEGAYQVSQDGMGDTLSLVKYRSTPFLPRWSRWAENCSFEYIFLDENTVEKLDHSGEVKLDGSETITIEFADMDYELRIKDLYTEKGIEGLKKKLEE